MGIVVLPTNNELKAIHMSDMIARQGPLQARGLAAGLQDGAVIYATERLQKAAGSGGLRILIVRK